MKARTSYHLSSIGDRKSKSGDKGDGRSGWERYVFNKSAPLDEDEVALETGEQHRMAISEIRNESGEMAKALRQINAQGAFHFSASAISDRKRKENEERHEAALFGSSNTVLGNAQVKGAPERKTATSVGATKPCLMLEEEDEDRPVIVDLPDETPAPCSMSKPSMKVTPSWRTLRKPKAPPS